MGFIVLLVFDCVCMGSLQGFYHFLVFVCVLQCFIALLVFDCVLNGFIVSLVFDCVLHGFDCFVDQCPCRHVPW